MKFSNKRNEEVRFNASELGKKKINPKKSRSVSLKLGRHQTINTNFWNHVQKETETDEFEGTESIVNYFLQNRFVEKFEENRY